MVKIILSMIVKNESKIIRRCLEAAKPIIDYWAICDTGSTDGTQEIIRETLAVIPGELRQSEFIDFSTNRNEALELARPHGDYILLIDADHLLFVQPSFCKESLNADYYYTREHGELDYELRLLIRSSLPWKFTGKTHECASTGGKITSEQIRGISRVDLADGGTRAEKFQRDIQLLSQEVIDDPNNARSWFYLAQSYWCIGDYQHARQAYRRRIDLGGWDEERWYAAWKHAECGERIVIDPQIIVTDYLEAIEFRPTRLESIFSLVAYLRKNGRYELGYLVGLRGIEIEYPQNDRLFIDRSIYSWRFADEFALCCHYAGRKELAEKYGKMAVAATRGMDRRLKDNLDWYCRATPNQLS